jgi:hypothetical protein
LRHLLDKFVGIGQFRGALDFLTTRARLTVGDVVPDRTVEQQRILQDETDLLAQRFLLEGFTSVSSIFTVRCPDRTGAKSN